MRVIRRHFLVCYRWTQLSVSPRTAHFRWLSFVDHVDHTAPRALGRWTTERPRKGTMRSQGRHSSGCPREEKYEGEAAIATE